MERVTEETRGTLPSTLSHDKLDMYIKECNNHAHTCRACADICAKDGRKFSEIVDVCLESAKSCEILARQLLLHKQGNRHLPQVQTEACLVTCRFCARRCAEKADMLECISVCAKSSLHCADIISMLLPKSAQRGGKGLFAFLRTPIGK
jgi:hypothetical protein